MKELTPIPLQGTAKPEAILKPSLSMTKTEQVKAMANRIKAGTALVEDIGSELGLTFRQMKFCQLYTTQEFFGNGLEAFGEAYGIDTSNKNLRNQAGVGANKALKNEAILLFIDILLDGEGLNDQFADKQLLMVMQQNSDLKSKMLALKTYYEINGRLKKSLEITVNNQFDYSALSAEELAQVIALSEKARVGKG